MNDILYQILLVLGSITLVALIFVLVRVYLVLTDLNDSTKIAKKRIRDLDKLISSLESSLSGLTELIKNFTNSYEKMKNIKEKVKNYFDKGNDEKGKKDE